MVKTIVVIPAYNEEATIGELIKRVLPFADVCVVDDASKDRTGEIVKSFPKVKYIRHKKNKHIARTTLDGMKYAVAKKYDYIITMDAGLSHLPEELPRFIKAPRADLVLGYRKKKVAVPLFRKFLSATANTLICASLRKGKKSLRKVRFRDVTSGYRRYSLRAAELLLSRKVKAKTFEFHTEALMFVYRNGLVVKEVPISYHYSNSSLNRKVVWNGFAMFLDILLRNRS